MSTVITARQPDEATFEATNARVGWQKRAVLVGGGFQVVFGALWLARGLVPLTLLAVAIAAGGVVLVAGLMTAVLLRQSAPRLHGSVARAIERRLTTATVLQLIASFVLPIVISEVAGPRLVLPSIVITIGILLVWIHHEVDTPYQGVAGWMLIGLSLFFALFAGSAETIITGLSSAVTLLGCAGAGFKWLRQNQRSIPD